MSRMGWRWCLAGLLVLLGSLGSTVPPLAPPAEAAGLFEFNYPEGQEIRIESGPPTDLDPAQLAWTAVPGLPGAQYTMFQEFMLLAFTGPLANSISASTLTAPDRLVFDIQDAGSQLKKPVAVTFPTNNLLTELRARSEGKALRIVLETLTPLPIRQTEAPPGWHIFWIGTQFEIRMQRTIAPHVIYLKRVMVDASGQRRVHLVKADLTRSGFQPTVATARDLNLRRATVGRMMEGVNGWIALNGGYFDSSGLPQGLIVRDEIMHNKPIMDRPSFARNRDGHLAIGFLPVIGVITGLRAQVQFDNINGHFNGSDIMLLAPGHPSRLAAGPQVEGAYKVVIENDWVRRVGFEPLTVEERQTCHALLVPPAIAYTANFQQGEQVRANYTIGRGNALGIDLALQAGPMLVLNGQVRVSTQGDFPRDIRGGRAPRSAIGLTPNNELILMAVDGRSKTAAGATLNELAAYLIEAGATVAMNLDGGSSTQMVVAGDLVTQNPAGNKPVANAIVLVDESGRFGRQDHFF